VVYTNNGSSILIETKGSDMANEYSLERRISQEKHG